MTTPPAIHDLREAVARWLESEVGFYVSEASEKAGQFCGPSGPIASELARLTERAEKAEADQAAAEEHADALNAKLAALAPHSTCACSYDKPGDVCAHHSPALAAAEAKLTTLKAAAARDAEVIARMREALIRIRDFAGSSILVRNDALDIVHQYAASAILTSPENADV